MRAVGDKSDRIELHKGPYPLDFRIMFVAFGLLFLAVGLFATAQVLLAVIGILLGRDFEGNFLLGVGIAVAFTGFGALSVWSFFIPEEHLVFDGTTKTLTTTRRYPFGRVWTDSFALADLDSPEVHWQSDADRSDGGFWCLRLNFPGGRRFDHEPRAHSLSGQKQAVETLRDNILALT